MRNKLTRRATKPLRSDLREDDFTLTGDEWELAVFTNASSFSVVRFMGRANYERKDFPAEQFLEAVAFWEETTPPGMRPRMLYAVTSAGRQVCLERSRREEWIALWRKVPKGLELHGS